MRTSIRKPVAAFLVCAAGVLTLWFLRPPQATGVASWGVTFSHTFAQHLGLDWRETYIALLDDLGVRALRIPMYWNEIEKDEGRFHFDDYDWMMAEAEKRGARITFVIGTRVPRWPECHAPSWTRNRDAATNEKAQLAEITAVVERYKRAATLVRWQIENEPFLPHFGECPPPDGDALDREIALVRFLDPSRPIVVTDSGELSTWFSAYKRADIFGTTMYRTVWSNAVSPTFGYITYPLSPQFFWLKANIARALFGDKPIIVSELQGEPWGPEFFRIAHMSKEERAYSMSLARFKNNIAYAQSAGFPEVYLWGAEWWYMLKTKERDSSYWDTARGIMQGK